ncbi:thioredoxin family protein [Microbacterium sp.]|uniref:thioredoxin family protein n=1 Tax=Microbacterium sp. TaxID=51671 RepID=UPI002736E5BA|nr:thioredoxin family protein [Microbacterium sp.]MDP3951616.1 thioredoxin family protein [Microbacterium sp.]
MDVALLYFDGCPNWKTTKSLLLDVMGELGVASDRLVLQGVETPEEAVELSFHGSPTVLVDGVDPFADPNAAVGLTCPLCPTETGWVGAPSRQQLTEALSSGM